MVVVLIPYTSPPYGRIAHPVGKCYAINIEAEKLTFSIGENPEDGRERFTFQIAVI